MNHPRPKKQKKQNMPICPGKVYITTIHNYYPVPKNSTSGSSKQICSLPQHQSSNQVTIITINAALIQSGKLFNDSSTIIIIVIILSRHVLDRRPLPFLPLEGLVSYLSKRSCSMREESHATTKM